MRINALLLVRRAPAWVVLTCVALYAGAGRAETLTLEEAMRLAADRSAAVAVAQTSTQRAEADWQRALGEWLPQVNGTVTYDRTLDTEFKGLLDIPLGDQPSPFTDLPFGRENNWKAGVSVVQSLFAGGRTQARLGMARLAQQGARASVASARAQAVLEVVEAYHDAMVARRMLQIAEEQEQLARRALEVVQAAHAEKTRSAFDVLRAEVALGNKRPAVLARRTAWEVAQRELRRLLELPPTRAFTLSAALDEADEGLPDLGVLARQAAQLHDDTGRVPVVLAETTVALRELQVSVAWSQHLPRLDATMTYQLVNYPESIGPDFDDVRRNWLVGMAVQVPVFAGFRVDADVDAARADLLEAQARLREARARARIDEAHTRLLLATAQETLEATRGGVRQAQRAVDIAALRFREGLSTQLELDDAQLLWAEARAQRAQAARDVQVARVRLALLPALPFGAPTSGPAAQALPTGMTTSVTEGARRP